MRRPGGRRSSSDFRKTWTCSHGHRNPPVHCEFFTIPALICGCGCKEEVWISFFMYFWTYLGL